MPQPSEAEIRGQIELIVGQELSRQVAESGLAPHLAQAELDRQRALPIDQLIANAEQHGIDTSRFGVTNQSEGPQAPGQVPPGQAIVPSENAGAGQVANTDPFTGSAQGTANSPGIGGIFENLANGDENILGGLQGGQGLADMFFAEGSLGRIRDVMSAEDRAQLENLQMLADSGGERSEEAKRALALLAQNAETAGQRSPEIAALIKARQDGLGGLTSPELQGLREQGFQGLQSGLQTALRAAGANAAASGIQGGAAGIATNPAIQSFARGTQGLERDILLANVAERERRKLSLQQLLQTQEAAEFDRSQTAREGFDAGLFKREKFETEDKASKLTNLLNFRQEQRNDLLNRRLVNLDLSERERAGRLGTILGGGQFGAATSGREAAVEAARVSGQFGLSAAQLAANAGLEGLQLQIEAFNNSQDPPLGGGNEIGQTIQGDDGTYVWIGDRWVLQGSPQDHTSPNTTDTETTTTEEPPTPEVTLPSGGTSSTDLGRGNPFSTDSFLSRPRFQFPSANGGF